MKSNRCSTGHSTPTTSEAARVAQSYPPDHPDASAESQFPAVPYDDPAWDNTDRWVLGPWLPEGATLSPSANGFPRMVRRAPKSGGRRHGRL
jgi:hypothetical protein